VNAAGAIEGNNIGRLCVRLLADADLNANQIANSEAMLGHTQKTNIA
jgi:hypothetical protein